MKKTKDVFQITGLHSFYTDMFYDVDFSHQKSVISFREPELEPNW
jgi:hypothetical protein